MQMDESLQTEGRNTEEALPPLPANARAVLRVGNEFLLRCIDGMAALAGDDLIKALIFAAMWTANVRHITHSSANAVYAGADDLPPDEQRQAVSVTALSNALHIPYETVRRYVHALMHEGSCIRLGRKGFIVPVAVLSRQSHRDTLREGYPSLLRLLSDMKRVGFDFAPYRERLPCTVPSPPPGELPPNARALLRVSMELVMNGIQEMGRLHDNDFLYSLIFSTIWTANVHHITSTAENLKFGSLSDIPPDEVRRPVTVHAIANSLRMPYETVRRYANRMVQDGSAVRVSGKGLIIKRERLASARSIDAVRNGYAHLERAIASLHSAGFDFSTY